MKKLTYYCPQYGLVHLTLLLMDWQEEHCRLDCDGVSHVKMVTWQKFEVVTQPNQYPIRGDYHDAERS